MMASRQSGSLEDIAEESFAPKRRAREVGETLLRRFCGPLLLVVAVASTCAVSVGVSVALIDRPVATWVHEYLGDQRFAWFTANYDGHLLTIGPFSLMASPAEALGPLAAFVFSALAMAVAAGWRPRIRGRIVLALCLSIFAAIEISGLVKLACGRTWADSWQGNNPSWIRDGVFGFFPFHGGRGWASFPSGHTTVITAPAAILWVVWSELRIAWAILVGVVAAGLIGANYHFVSDIIGGLYLGASIGIGIVGLTLPNDRLSWSIVLNSTPPEESLR